MKYFNLPYHNARYLFRKNHYRKNFLFHYYRHKSGRIRQNRKTRKLIKIRFDNYKRITKDDLPF